MPKFILDVGVGKMVHTFLLEEGYDAIAVSDYDPQMGDGDILSFAAGEQRMVITMDKDFGDLVYHSGQHHYGVLLLRLDDATGQEKCAVVKAILENYESALGHNFCVYMNGNLRIRKKL